MSTAVAVIKGDNTVLFGAAGVYSGTGIVTGGNNKLDGEKLEVVDATGYTVAVIYFNEKNECSFEMIVKTAAPALARGDEINLCGIAGCQINDTEQIWANKDVRKFRVSATKYVNIAASI